MKHFVNWFKIIAMTQLTEIQRVCPQGIGQNCFTVYFHEQGGMPYHSNFHHFSLMLLR
jgi:hypothetical protein